MNTEHRIVLLDGHIIAQFNQHTGPMQSSSWYTCNRSENNDESDFAVWPLTQTNLAKAHRLMEDHNHKYSLLEAPASHHVEQHNDSKWYIYRSGEVDICKAYNTQNEALRNLAHAI